MKKLFLLLTLLIICCFYKAQETKKELTLEDAVLGYYKGLYPENMRGLNWSTNNNLYQVNRDSILIYSPTSKVVKKRLSISKDVLKDTSTQPIRGFEFNNYQSFTYNSKDKLFIIENNEQLVLETPKEAANQQLSPNKKAIAFTIENNLLFLKNSELIEVTKFTNSNIVAGQTIHRNEFGITKGIFWSNNSEKIAFYEKDETDVHNYPLLDISTTPGSLNSVKYPMAGQKSEYAKVGVYNLSNKNLIYLQTNQHKDDYVSNLTWGPNDEFIYIAELNRDQNHLKWAKYNGETGERIQTLFEEKNEKWVEPEHPLYFIPGKINEFITLSERDGFMNIYHYNTNGKLISQVTKNQWVVNKIKRIVNNTIYFEGTGPDPRSMHTFSINLSGNNQKQITKEKGIHRTKLSPNSKYLLNQYSQVENPGVTQVINLKTRKIVSLHNASNPLDDYQIAKTELVELKTKEGINLYGRLIKPSFFNENEKYPVLVYVYGGPHAQLVTNEWMASASLWMHWMAEKGYLVFTLDGRGSANRGFEFESSIFRNLGDIEMKDQILGLNYLKSLNCIDTNKLAVHGWSYGGFMTTSLMTRYPKLFDVGVAGGPVIDWKWYEVMYGERYMDQPYSNPEGYESNSLLNHAKNLVGNLLLIHGTTDDVVLMQHNLAFIQKCIEEKIHVDFFPYPMHKHNVRGKDRVHLMKKVLNYILTNHSYKEK